VTNSLKIAIAFPPLTGPGSPLLTQNRQFQWFDSATFIYPVIPAYCATMLKQSGHQVFWLDGIAEEKLYKEWLSEIVTITPDVIVIETKTPVIKQHWHIIDEIKSQLPETKVILCGDHVTALPEESMNSSGVDFIATGGDYDFLIINICAVISGKVSDLSQGIWYRDNNTIKNSGKFKLSNNLNSLPVIDRELTKWELYSINNGNFRETPGTYVMSGRDCWYHRCSFCSWTTLYPEFRTRSVKNVVDEIELLVNQYGVKEIMDDTGSFPIGEWLHDFCEEIIKRELHKKITLDCNMRFGALTFNEYCLMKKAGFRLILFGLESANQETLDKLKKGINISNVIDSCKLAHKAGLYPHITIMFGYPWETLKMSQNTLKLGRFLLKKGYAYTVQATIMIPYPGTPLFDECKTNNWLLTEDWDEYDMRKPVMKTLVGSAEIASLVRKLYSIAFHPAFIWNKICSVKSVNDLLYYAKAAKKVFGHITDFA